MQYGMCNSVYLLYCTVTAATGLWLWSTDCLTLFILQTREKNQ